MNDPIKKIQIAKFSNGGLNLNDDIVAVEEPLEISLMYWENNECINKKISITMRTPGDDSELAVGFLFTEGIIKSYSEVLKVSSSSFDSNKIIIELNITIVPDIEKLQRNFYTTSSCGVCGKSSIESIRTVSIYNDLQTSNKVNPSVVFSLPNILKSNQKLFKSTGGIHASAIFDYQGNLIILKEDVGRHNALDKLIGRGLKEELLPMKDQILLLSGRASFELIQKAAMAGIRFIVSVGAPSSLAVELATEFKMTLIGFLNEVKFNIYTGADRLEIT